MPVPESFPDDPFRMMDHFGKRSLIIGLILMLIGVIGIAAPWLIALQTALLIAALFIIGGVFWAIHTYQYGLGYWSDWIKPALLLVSGLLILIYPKGGVAVIGLLLAFYLLMDAVISFSMAFNLRPIPGWGWMAFNGTVSLLLALLFLVGWPESSMFMVGIFVAISLLIDGIVLAYFGWMQRRMLR